MRTIALLAVSAAVTALALGLAGDVLAAPPVPAPGPKLVPGPMPMVHLPVTFADVRRTPTQSRGPQLYSDGPLSYDVEINNPSGTAFTGELDVGAIRNPLPGVTPDPVTKIAVSIPPNAKAWVTFSDPEGLRRGSCWVTKHRLTLGTVKKDIKTTPNCTFTSQAVDPFAAVPPDTKQAQRANKMYYVSPTFTNTKVTCDDPLVFTAQIRNSSSTSSPNARLQIDGPNENDNAMSSAHAVTAGQTSVAVQVKKTFELGYAGNYTLKIMGDAAPLFQPGWRVEVKRTCQLAVALD